LPVGANVIGGRARRAQTVHGALAGQAAAGGTTKTADAGAGSALDAGGASGTVGFQRETLAAAQVVAS
jgi:hypothetical protein